MQETEKVFMDANGVLSMLFSANAEACGGASPDPALVRSTILHCWRALNLSLRRASRGAAVVWYNRVSGEYTV